MNIVQPFPVVYTKMIARELHLYARAEKQLFAGTPHCGCSCDQFGSEEIDAETQYTIVENALEISGNPALGLQWGNTLPMAAHGPLGVLLSTSASLAVALDDLLAFSKIRQNVVRFGKTIRNDELAITVELFSPHDEVGLFFIEAALVSLKNLVRYFVGRLPGSVRVELNYPPPRHAEMYSKFINVKARFNCEKTAIIIPQNWAQASNPFADAFIYEQTRIRCEDLAANVTRKIRWKVRACQTMLLTPGRLSLHKLAENFNMSPRTLMRHLENEGTNFRDLRDDVMARRAIYYLEEKQWKIEAVAVALGYKDSSAFRRAFYRWYGHSPTAHLKKLDFKKQRA